MIFEFTATAFNFDLISAYVGFWNEDTNHYFIIQRGEDVSSEKVEPLERCLDEIYIELDDQGWGGFGGCEKLLLSKNRIVIFLNKEMRRYIQNHYEAIRINFETTEKDYQLLQTVLKQIVTGCEGVLLIHS
jgi:hypothetical protein